MVEYQFNDIEAAKQAANTAATLSEKIEGLCALLQQKAEKISGLTNTFSINTQVYNRVIQLSNTLGEFKEPLDNIAADVKRLALNSEKAMEASKNAMM